MFSVILVTVIVKTLTLKFSAPMPHAPCPMPIVTFILSCNKKQMELYFKTRKEWRRWIEKNHSTVDSIWIIFYKKHTGKPCLAYVDAVEEALCYGWIDGKIKRINDEYYVQRYTPRRLGSRWSKYNVERIEKLIKEGRMEPVGLKAFKEALEKPELIYDNKVSGEPLVPEDLMNAFNDNEKAYGNFMNFSQSARRIYIEWLNSAKKAETRPGRIEKIIKLAEQNRKPGMM
jgi:uncharacterized protein YdeI (YjbR/CyaY-like superfamily)